MSTKRPRSPSPDPAPSTRKPPSLATLAARPPTASQSITDRQSRFIAYYHPTLSPTRLVQSLPSIATADHKITAWRHTRVPIAGTKKVYDTGCNDDGEAHAGKKALSVLQGLDVTGSVVVARWWGGIMLGPARFAHIETCARGAVDAFLEVEKEEARQREDAERKEVLVADLSERDKSIAALRGLLDWKRGVAASPAAKSVDYDCVELAWLEALSKARDGTIAFLLKRLDDEDAAATGGATTEQGKRLAGKGDET